MKNKIVLLVLVVVLLVMAGCSTTNSSEENVPPPSLDDTGDNNATHGDSTTESEDNNNAESEKPNGDSKPDNNAGGEVETEKPVPPPKPVITYDKVAMVTSNKVNIREGKSSNSRVVGTMKRGEGLMIVEENMSGWHKVYYKGKHAYIYGSNTRVLRFPKSNKKSIEKVIEEGQKLVGFPYVYGSQRYHFGNGILNTKFRYGEFDCSALTQYAYYKGANVIINVTTRSQVMEGMLVRGDIRRGDLLFFTNSSRRHKKGVEKVGHVAIYLGDNHIMHTSEGYAVIEEISNSRWNNYLVSKRYIV